MQKNEHFLVDFALWFFNVFSILAEKQRTKLIDSSSLKFFTSFDSYHSGTQGLTNNFSFLNSFGFKGKFMHT